MQQILDADVVVGYPDGTLRTYTIKDFVVEQGAQIMQMKPSTGSTTQSNPPSSNSILTPHLFIYVGLGLLTYHALGAGGLIAVGLTLLWFRAIWQRSLTLQAKQKNANQSK